MTAAFDPRAEDDGDSNTGRIPANYQDPPADPSKMGWGDSTFNIAQRSTIERGLQENLKIAVPASFAVGASSVHEKIEAAIRKQFKFDEGFSFYVTDRMVYGTDLMLYQLIGNCVGASHAMLCASRYAYEILAEGDPEEPLGTGMLGCPWIPYSYGVGRLVGDMLGPGDGSYCGAQIEGTQKYGFIPCFTEGLDRYGGELPQSSAEANRLLGRSRAEIEKWMAKAKPFDLLEAPRCESADDAKLLVCDRRIPLQICSGWGFRYWKRDANGVELYRPSGSWAHSMQVCAVFRIKGQWYVAIRNQWGNEAHLGSPEQGIPRGSFVITIEDFAKWVRSAECIGIGQIQGLPVKPIA